MKTFVCALLALTLGACAASKEPAPPAEPWAPDLESLRTCGDDLVISIRGPMFRTMMAEGCERVRNSLNGTFDYELDDLSFATPLRRVDGNLSFRENPFTSFRGLERLESVGAVFGAVNVPALRDATGLNNLRLVEGSLDFFENPQLRSFTGLERLERVGQLLIVRNPVLEDLDGLSGLRRVDGDVQIIDNPDLTQEEIDEFLSHVVVTGRVQLAYDPFPP